MVRSVPTPGVLWQLGATMLLLFGGAGAGAALAATLAAESHLAAVVGFVALPLALVTGYQLWIGVAVVMLIPDLVRVLAGRTTSATRGAAETLVPPGAGAFVATGAGWGIAAGTVVGLLAGPVRFLPALVLFAAVGLVYGLAARSLAGRAYLPFPAES